MKRLSAFEPDSSPFPPSDRPLSTIGRKAKPIRVLSFAGSGFDAAMQLGVVHALLVSRARAPDVVIGASVGAVSAVALAEVLQASDVDNPGPRVARFRELFEAYRRAPGEILHALAPDPVQVDTQRPLETLQLPVHHERERAGRRRAVASRAGLINLYNTLLNVRITVGTIARGVRCWLGIQGAKEIRNRVQRAGVLTAEWFRVWILVGTNLHAAATFFQPFLRAAIPGERRDQGASAAELIFAASAWRGMWQRLKQAFWTLVLIEAWLFISALAVAAITVVSYTMLSRMGLSPSVPFAFVIGVSGLTLAFIVLTRAKRWRLVLPVLVGIASVLVLMLVGGAVFAVVLALPLLLDAGYGALAAQTAFRWPWRYGTAYWITVPSVFLFIAVVTGLGLWFRWRDLGRRILALYDLDAGLLDPDALRQFLVRVFDPDRYNVANPAYVIDRALEDDNSPHGGPIDAKLIGEYAYKDLEGPSRRIYQAKPNASPAGSATPPSPIHVAVAVADVASGKLTTVPPYIHVVTALLAALAKPPFFPAVSCFGRLLVDATALTYEPTQAVLALLREAGVEPEASVVHLYTVAPFPFGQPELGRELDENSEPRRYTRLLDVVRRVLLLRRFRDATLERRLTELHTRAMPLDDKVFFEAGGGRRFLRVWVYPIEPERPLTVTYLTMQANTEEERRRTMAQTVADGCRAALEMMIQSALDAEVKNKPDTNGILLCRHVLARHLAEQQVAFSRLPGSAPVPDEATSDAGPGIAEVCEHCVLFRNRKENERVPRSLLVRSIAAPVWPARQAPVEKWIEPSHVSMPSEKEQERRQGLHKTWHGRWPRPRDGVPVDDRSTVSLLFSGGVFRGVFQIGVLNAISEASLRPDIVAGASVGSITSAMAARAFVTPGLEGRDALPPRRAFIRQLAAAYLAIDRLILTDRFADFVRGFTVRAARATFSIREADRVMRRFDSANPWTFSRELRRVLAGLERLAYVSPFELRQVVEAFRRQQLGTGMRLLEDYFQELLSRAGVGQEVLGAEPLERLINDYVLEGLASEGMRPAHVTFQQLLMSGTFFFATATNLSAGRLDALGADQLDTEGSTLNLLQALLASSAFPGVFRRRWSWEVESGTGRPEEYADGGVMDNLPLDAVAHFLDRAGGIGLINRRPPVPHLILSASLETAPQEIRDPDVLAGLCDNWLRLRSRTGELAYNRKLDLFERTQENLRLIMEARGASVDPKTMWTPLDLEVLTVIPRWLCGTMAFHPMLGFRRHTEAESIAHGCASTLLALGRRVGGSTAALKAQAWGMDLNALPSAEQSNALDPFTPLQSLSKKQTGHCWFRPGALCPFSYQGQGKSANGNNARTVKELEQIYQLCKEPKTHQPR